LKLTAFYTLNSICYKYKAIKFTGNELILSATLKKTFFTDNKSNLSRN